MKLDLCFTTLSRLLFIAITLVALPGNAATVWNGPLITYSQPSPDPTQAANQDRITPNAWITRAASLGIFNAKTETSFTHFFSPADTQWADGNLSSFASLTYHDWDTWAKVLHGGPPNTVGLNAVVHLVSDNIYLSLKFTQWGQSGGGFAYQRSTAPVVVTPGFLNFRPLPNAVVLSWTNSALSLGVATNLAGPYFAISGASSPFTNSISGSQRFFRLMH